MNTKKCLIILSAIIIASALLLLTACNGKGYLTKKPDPPEVEYGEFPFKVTYKLNGEIYTVENVYICEYDGLSWNEGTGFENKWNDHIKDTDDDVLFITEQDGVKLLCIVGDSWYYMGQNNNTKPFEPHFICEYKHSSGLTVFTGDDKYIEKFDVELLEWELSEPLVTNDDN